MESLWKRFQDRLYVHPGLQLFLDVSRMRGSAPMSGVTQEVL
jgi:hypothetical protein